MAREILEEFGDSALGEWVEDRPRAYHLRRRLTTYEQWLVGDVADLRGTEEAIKRLTNLKSQMAGWGPMHDQLAAAELADRKHCIP